MHVHSALEEILRHYNSDAKIDDIVSSIVNQILLFKISKRLYEKTIRKIHPRVIVEECHYSFVKMVCNQIAHENGIPVIELQHGTMHEDHIAYQYADDAVDIPLLPDYIFTFSDYWNRVVNLPKTRTKLISTGFPYFEKGVKKAKREVIRSDNRTTIIFISPGLETSLPEIAIDIARRLDNNSYRIIYKLHPLEYNMSDIELAELIRGDIELVRGPEPKLYDLFAQSNIQVSTFSTAIYEGFGFDLKTYILDEGWASTMKTLVDEGYATFFSSTDELIKQISRDAIDKRDNMVMRFWKNNAIENMKRELDCIISM